MVIKTKSQSQLHMIQVIGMCKSQLEYASVIRRLIYGIHCIKIDIAFAIGMLSRFTSNPGKEHWDDIPRILRYLMKTMNYGLHY
jgi:hypothetical protein